MADVTSLFPYYIDGYVFIHFQASTLRKFFSRQLDKQNVQVVRQLWIYNSQASTFQYENRFTFSVILTLFGNYPSFQIFVRFSGKTHIEIEACTLVILFQK